MVKIAIAGGSGGMQLRTDDHQTHSYVDYSLLAVANEVLDALLAAGRHEITILSRNVSK